MTISKVSSLTIMFAAILGMSGCGQSTDSLETAATATDRSATASHETEHSHDGWWCAEHGVPEEVCTRCSPKLVAEFKAKGDWCEEHDRPESQCFICHPEKKAEFAALYQAKYGTQPPEPIADEDEHVQHDQT